MTEQRHRTPLVTMLMIAGHDPSLAATIHTSQSQAFILDLEDTVPPLHKRAALSKVSAFLQTNADTRPMYVRVNSLESGMLDTDVETVVRAGACGINVPKVESAEHVRHVDYLIDTFETSSPQPATAIELMGTIESAAGAITLSEICAASPRMRCVCVGVGDLASELGLSSTGAYLSPTIEHVQSKAVLASIAAGLEPPHDSTHGVETDYAGLSARALRTRDLGFVGKHALFESHIESIERIYS